MICQPDHARRHDNQHNDSQHNDTKHKWLIYDTQHKRHTAKQYQQIVIFSFLTKVEEIQAILNYLRRHLTVFPSDFNNIYHKYFGILQNLTRNYEILRKFTKVYESLR